MKVINLNNDDKENSFSPENQLEKEIKSNGKSIRSSKVDKSDGVACIQGKATWKIGDQMFLSLARGREEFRILRLLIISIFWWFLILGWFRRTMNPVNQYIWI